MTLENTTGLTSTIRIVFADSQQIFRNGLRVMFENQERVIIIGEASNGRQLIDLVEEKQPDIVFTDTKMPVISGIAATKIIKQKFPKTTVIALSMFEEPASIIEMLDAGAEGYILKNTNAQELLHAVRIIREKGSYYCSSTSNKLVKLMAGSNVNPFKARKRNQFSEREIDIMRLICQEESNKEIASKLSTTVRSVESTRERIQEKVGARNMVGIAKYAIQNGIFSLEEC